jgi:branched-chain amino acid transport system permease protein
MFAPFGIAGFLMMHAPLWHAGTLWRVIPAYLLGLLPGLVMLMGVSLLIELTVHVTVKSTEGPMMSFLKISLNSHSVLPWIAAVALIAAGYWLLQTIWPRVEAAWYDAVKKTRERGGAA